MKRAFLVLLILTMICCSVLCTPVSASTLTESKTTIEYLENGDYIETIITWETSPTRASKKASKTANYKGSGDTTLWSITVTGTFTYNGSTSSCTACSHSSQSYNSLWTINSVSSSRSGNTATATGTATLQLPLVAPKTYSMSVKLTCSANGTLS